MKQFISYINTFIRKDYSLRTYLLTLLLLSGGILANYYFNIENEIICGFENKFIRFPLYLFLYGFAYYGTLSIYYFSEGKNYFSNKEVMVKSFIAIALISFDGAFVVTKEFLQGSFTIANPEAIYVAKIINQILPTIFYLLGIIILLKKYNATSSNLYGLTIKGFHWKPYFVLLLMMLPLLFWAASQNSFIEQYPFFKYWKYENAFGLSQKQLFYFYESFYLLSFVNVELLFRGLLVVGMIKCMDHKAVLPMIVTYAFLHFGKPLPETISSAFGGYILGIIAYQTENIFGGLMIHIGIAALMDILAIWKGVD